MPIDKALATLEEAKAQRGKVPLLYRAMMKPYFEATDTVVAELERLRALASDGKLITAT